MQVFTDYRSKVPVKAWVDGVEFEEEVKQQLLNLASLPFIFKQVDAMADCHAGKGGPIGGVVVTDKAIIPAVTGVDLGCGVIAVRTQLTANDLPDNLYEIRLAIEAVIPHGRTNSGGENDKGAWGWNSPREIGTEWSKLQPRLSLIEKKHKKINTKNARRQLASLGSGNHYLEICLDEINNVWLTLHSGSRGVGNAIGSYFISLAKEDMRKHFINLPDQNLAYLVEGTDYFNDYIEAISWSQDYARINRELMLIFMTKAISDTLGRPIIFQEEVINNHHNYCVKENHFGKNVWVTRKGAVRARENDLALIPGSMGTKSYVIKGKGNPESFMSCSHGAGRKMSRTKAKSVISLEDHLIDTQGIECRKDAGVIDESPKAYKDIDAVMEAQKDLVEIVHVLKQVVNVKG